VSLQDHDPTDLRGQDETRAEQEARSRFDARVEVDDIKWLMGSPQGRRILWRLLDQAGVFRLSFNSNAMQMAFAEGNRNFGNRTLSLIHAHCAKQFATMLKEHRDVRDIADNGHNDH
jgi:hypothetical protein